MGGDSQRREIKEGSSSDFQGFHRLTPEPEPRKHIKKQG